MKPAAHKQAGQRVKSPARHCETAGCAPATAELTGQREKPVIAAWMRSCGVSGSCYITAKRTALNPSYHLCFTGCNLRCEFCTVAEWNEQPLAAAEADYDVLKKKIAKRIRQGAKTLNLLGGEPAVNIYGILELLGQLDCETKVVWNSNMYYNDIVDELMDGLVDVYLADLKVGNNQCAETILGGGRLS